MTKQDIESKAIELIINQKTQWEDAIAYITDKVAFNMRNLIRQCRKNYWGIFDVPNDEETGKQKIWAPLTQEACENSAKNHSIDTKDINFISKKIVRRMITKVLKGYTLNKLKDMNYGELLKKANRDLDINGTVVWKIQEDEHGKPLITNVDLLNFYIDPTAESIKKTPAVIERVVMTPDEVKGMKDWINTDGLEGREGVEKTGDKMNRTESKQKLVEVFIFEGLAPEYLMTGKSEDTENIPLRMVISYSGGEKDKTGSRCHLIEKLPVDEAGEAKKSYEECWLTRVSGRWYGQGTAEKLIMMQLWMNLVINTRKTRNEIASLGLFKIRDGCGITPQAIKRLPVNGAIKMKDMNDLEQLVVQEATQGSYNDENVIKSWAQRVTQTFEMVTGETMAATTTATVGAIQSRSAATFFEDVKENIGMWQERVLNNHLVPMLCQKINREEIVKICLDADELREYDDEYAEMVAEEYIQEKGKDGIQYIDVNEIEQLKAKVKENLAKGSDIRYHELTEDVELDEYVCEVFVDKERIDKNVIVTDLINMAKLVPQYADVISRKLFDILGLDVKLPGPAEIQNAQQGQAINKPQSATDQMKMAMTGAAMGING